MEKHNPEKQEECRYEKGYAPAQQSNWFKPGQSGNPNGRPLKGKILTSYLESELNKVDPNDEHHRTRGEVLAQKVLDMAMKGHGIALKEVWDRIDGKVTQPIGADADMPITIQLVPAMKQDSNQDSNHNQRNGGNGGNGNPNP